MRRSTLSFGTRLGPVSRFCCLASGPPFWYICLSVERVNGVPRTSPHPVSVRGVGDQFYAWLRLSGRITDCVAATSFCAST